MSNKPNRRPSAAARARVAKANEPPSRVPWIIGAAIVVVVLAVVLAVVVTRSSTDSASTTGTIKGGGTVVPNGQVSYGDVIITGAALPEQPDGSPTDPALGKHAPTISGEQFNGASLTLPAPGKPAIVMFVAHWCPHCQKEVPEITRWLNANGMPQDVNLYTVATSTSDQRPNYPPAEWLNGEGWPVPTIADDQSTRAAEAFGIGGFPYFVALDANGNVVQRASGELSMEEFQALLSAARRTTPTATSG